MPAPITASSLDLSTFGGRLYLEILKKYGSIRKFAEKNGYYPADINLYTKNKTSPKIDKIYEFEKCGLNVSFILFGDSTNKNNKNENIQELNGLKIIGSLDDDESDVHFILEFKSSVRGGTWNLVENDASSMKPVPKWFVKNIKKPAMVKVVGDSMAPEIKNKDLVVFEMNYSLKNKDIIICTYDCDTMVKEYRKHKDKIILNSFNPKYEPIEVNSSLVIHGVVKKVFHDLTI